MLYDSVPTTGLVIFIVSLLLLLLLRVKTYRASHRTSIFYFKNVLTETVVGNKELDWLPGLL